MRIRTACRKLRLNEYSVSDCTKEKAGILDSGLVDHEMVAGVRFELTTFGLCDLTQLSLRVGLYLHPCNGMLAIQSLRLPRSSEAWFGIAIPEQRV